MENPRYFATQTINRKELTSCFIGYYSVVEYSIIDRQIEDEDRSANRKGKRQYLNESKNRDFVNRLNRYFETRVTIPRIRRGDHQEIETLINKEVLFTRYLRDERPTWNPGVVSLDIVQKVL